MFDSSVSPLVLEGREVGLGRPTWIVAEIGINHEGNAGTCARMIEEAAVAGADAIKLQTVDADASYTRESPSYALFKESALTAEETAGLFRLTRQKGMAPFTTVADLATIDWVDRLEPAAHKVSSGLLSTLPVVRHLARTGRPLILSTGMSYEEDIDLAVDAARAAGAQQIALLHCTSIYPAPVETLNLAAIGWMAKRWQVPAGFSDHSLGEVAAPLAVSAGACIVEKHFTLDVSRPGYDHHIGLDPAGFRRMVDGIRLAEGMRGRPGRNMTEAELSVRKWARRAVVAKCAISAGETLTAGHLTFKRPPPGVEPGLAPDVIEALIGHKVTRALAPDEVIRPADIMNWAGDSL